MSEPVFLIGSNRYHDLPERTQEEVDAAYYEALTSPAGRIIMDDLYSLVCCSRLTKRGLGQVDLRNYLLARMQAHQSRLRASERYDDGA